MINNANWASKHIQQQADSVLNYRVHHQSVSHGGWI